MAYKKRKLVNHEPFQTDKNGKGRFAALYHDMMDSKAWLELSGNDVKLYLMFLRKYQISYKDGDLLNTNSNDICMTKKGKDGNSAHWGYCGHWNMYQNIFERSIDNLIDKGFIKVVADMSHNTGNPVIYGFSDLWKQYGEPGFEVPENNRRRKRKKGYKRKGDPPSD